MIRVAMLCSSHEVNDERVTYKQARSLARSGYEVIVFGMKPANLEEIPPVHLYPFTPKGRGLIKQFSTMIKLYYLAKSWKPDIITCHEPQSAIVGLLLKWRYGMKMVFDSHESFQETFSWRMPWPFRPFLKAVTIVLLNVLVRKADWVTVVSPANKQFLGKVRHDARIDILHNSPLIQLFPPCNHDIDGHITVVHDGELYRQRGLIQMLEAIAIARRSKDIRFLIIGRISSQDQKLFDQKVEQLGLKNSIIMPGWKLWEEIGQIESQAQIGLICHQYTPNSFLSLNNKLYNYMSCGQAIIGPEGSTTADMLRKYNCGLCIDTSDPEMIATSILKLANDKSLRKLMGANGRKAVEQELGWHKMEERLNRIYGQLALEAKS